MSLAFWLWIASILNGLNFLIGFGFFACILLAIFCFVVMANTYDEDEPPHIYKECKKILNKYWVLILLSITLVLLPDQKTIYLMIGSNYLQNSAIPTKVVNILNMKIDDIMQDMQKDKSK